MGSSAGTFVRWGSGGLVYRDVANPGVTDRLFIFRVDRL
jgi:hypothetical protein